MKDTATPADAASIVEQLGPHGEGMLALHALRNGNQGPLLAWLKKFIEATGPNTITIVLIELREMLSGTDPHWRLELVRQRAGNSDNKRAVKARRKYIAEIAENLYNELLGQGAAKHGLRGQVEAWVADRLPELLSMVGDKERRRISEKASRPVESDHTLRREEYVRKVWQEHRRNKKGFN